jgi:spore germination protein YaaH
VLAIPPVVPSTPGRPGAELEHMQQLSKHVDGFSIMTYDYSVSGPGPNAPLTWQEENVKGLISKSTAGTTGKPRKLPRPPLAGQCCMR